MTESGDQLELSPGQPVWYLRRLRLADGEPLAILDSYLPAGLSTSPGRS